MRSLDCRQFTSILNARDAAIVNAFIFKCYLILFLCLYLNIFLFLIYVCINIIILKAQFAAYGELWQIAVLIPFLCLQKSVKQNNPNNCFFK